MDLKNNLASDPNLFKSLGTGDRLSLSLSRLGTHPGNMQDSYEF